MVLLKVSLKITHCYDRWINQIVAVVNRVESSVIEEKVIQIAKRYP